ncbi:GntR family transcriptional regulator [Kosakonia sp. BK9b]|uniref:GntR family transcriptional regulator n=1 Tax=Kosakonia sp. TaxID=1916651 RepID=UPI0028A25EC6|nr:GntR family transcriptional regulator [Kosakonia sp.]
MKNEKLSENLNLEGQSKYKQIIDIMIEKIVSGQWAAEFVIPSERELAEGFGVNRITVRKAIAHLKQRGYLHSAAKQGNYVLPPRSHDSHLLYSFSDDIKRNGGKPGQTVLEFSYVPVSEVTRTNLQMPLTMQTVLKIKRIRFSDTTPMGIQTSYLKLKPEQKIDRQELEDRGSLYHLLEEKYGIEMVEAYESIGARLPSAAERQHLEIGSDEVVLTTSRITYASDRKPIEYVETIYPTSRYVYQLKVSKDTFEY